MKNSFYLLAFVCITFQLLAQERYAIVINEIMADPSPPVSLPNYEWIELKNTSNLPINLQGWRIADGSSQSGPMPSFILKPDSFVIVSAANASPSLSVYGEAISVAGFPNLDNEGDQVSILSPNHLVIHAVEYNLRWYRNELKKEGGWTLEMIDSRSACEGQSNWKASQDMKGGSPCKINSINGILEDQQPPCLIRTYSEDSVTVIAIFDEPIDSLSSVTASNFTVDGGISIISVHPIMPMFDRVRLKLNRPLDQNLVYSLTAKNIRDCKGNIIGSRNVAKLGISQICLSSDIVINEILFNPRSNGYDYVEILNRSDKIIDAAGLHIANRNNNGSIASIRRIRSTPFYIFPSDYLLVTEDADNLQLNYLVENPEAIQELSSLPSFPDDEGNVVFLNAQGDLIDEVKYKDDWHFKLIANNEGISLERIDPSDSSQKPMNWHSAASTSGYGTPTYKNSQFRRTENILASIELIPKIFSPDNDGHDDIATIQYQLTEPGFVANISIFDANGRPVRWLVRNDILGLKGSWTWDGLGESGNKLPVGIYIVLAEIFNLQGKTQKFKNTVVLSSKF